MTNLAKGYPFEVTVPSGYGVTGVILADHVKSVDWKARRAERLERCPMELLNEVLARRAPLLGYGVPTVRALHPCARAFQRVQAV